jgi:hypothetical protein
MVYLINVPICWQSKAQSGVTLSCSEVEYVAISESMNEIKFVYYLLKDVAIEVNLPVIMKTDNKCNVYGTKIPHPT